MDKVEKDNEAQREKSSEDVIAKKFKAYTSQSLRDTARAYTGFRSMEQA